MHWHFVQEDQTTEQPLVGQQAHDTTSNGGIVHVLYQGWVY